MVFVGGGGAGATSCGAGSNATNNTGGGGGAGGAGTANGGNGGPGIIVVKELNYGSGVWSLSSAYEGRRAGTWPDGT